MRIHTNLRVYINVIAKPSKVKLLIIIFLYIHSLDLSYFIINVWCFDCRKMKTLIIRSLQ